MAQFLSKPFGMTPNGEKINEYIISNPGGLAVSVLNYGCIIKNIWVPTKSGPVDVVLGHDTYADYVKDFESSGSTCCGAFVGRYANRIENAMFNVGGKGHSCGIYSFDDDHIHRLGMCAPVSRIMVRQPNNRGNSGSSTNGMPPTSSMGCGTWGGNIVSENICLKHYMNTTWVARPLPEDMPSNEELFGEFNKPDMDVE